MDLEALLQRPPLTGARLTLVIPIVRRERLSQTCQKALALLAARGGGDELLLIVTDGSLTDLPARRAGVRIRPVPAFASAGGESLPDLVAQCRHPVILLADEAVSLTRAELDAFLKAIDQADLAVGARPAPLTEFSWPLRWAARGLTYLLHATALLVLPYWCFFPVAGWLWLPALAWTLVCLVRAGPKWFFGVPIRDPFCVIKAMRKQAVANLPLETSAALAGFELVAKLTYRSALMDDVPIGAWLEGSSFWREAFAQPSRMLRLLVFPRFWRYDRTTVCLPTALHALSPPAPVIARPPRIQRALAQRPEQWGPRFPRQRLGPLLSRFARQSR